MPGLDLGLQYYHLIFLVDAKKKGAEGEVKVLVSTWRLQSQCWVWMSAHIESLMDRAQ